MAGITIAVSGSGTDLARQGRALPEVMLAAVEAGMAGVAAGLVQDARQDIRAAFPNSSRMPTTVTGKAYGATPAGLPPAALLHPRRGSNIGAVLVAHTGTTILPKAGAYLAIPLRGVPRAGNDGRRRPMTPDEYRKAYGEKSLTFVRARSGRAAGYLVAPLRAGVDYPKAGQRGRRRAPAKRYKVLYVLIRQAVLAPRLRPEVTLRKWADLAPHYIQQAATAAGIGA